MADAKLIPAPAADWQGDGTENPFFRTVGKMSPPVMRKIEPYGAQFRESMCCTFNEGEEGPNI